MPGGTPKDATSSTAQWTQHADQENLGIVIDDSQTLTLTLKLGGCCLTLRGCCLTKAKTPLLIYTEQRAGANFADGGPPSIICDPSTLLRNTRQLLLAMQPLPNKARL
jgi:hypothetical protein